MGSPDAMLRMALAERRSAGLPWNDADYRALVRKILGGVSNYETRKDWKVAFTSQRSMWRRAYLRAGKASALTVELMDD